MLTDAVALVTGASRGLGFAVAREAAARGAHVLALARTVGGLEELDDAVRAAGGQATLVPLDLADDPALDRLAQAIAGRWGRLDLWVHCAVHPAPLSPAPMIDGKDIDRTLAAVKATQHLIAALDPLLRAAPAGRAVLPDDPHEAESFYGCYAAGKAATRALWQAWARETRSSRFRPVLFTPPPMPTAVRARFFPGEDKGSLTPAAAVAPVLLDAAGSA